MSPWSTISAPGNTSRIRSKAFWRKRQTGDHPRPYFIPLSGFACSSTETGDWHLPATFHVTRSNSSSCPPSARARAWTARTALRRGDRLGLAPLGGVTCASDIKLALCAPCGTCTTTTLGDPTRGTCPRPPYGGHPSGTGEEGRAKRVHPNPPALGQLPPIYEGKRIGRVRR